MTLEHHSLLNELPEHADKIHTLKTENAHFRKLFDEYHEVDKEVFRIESGEEARADLALEDLKKKRLTLKDELFAIISE
jgi:uncharacterized protein YdcH (DUF465 family)